MLITGRFLVAVLCLPLAGGPLWGAGNTGTSTASFLRLEQGTRAIGMGSAFSAVADDASSLWWNPAGMARATYREANVSYTRLIENINTQYIAVLFPISPTAGALGGSFSYLNIPGLDGFDANGNSSGKLTANAYAASLAYGRFLVDRLSFGANLKLVGQKFATESGSGFAADAGLQYKQDKVGVGVSVQNMGPHMVVAGAAAPLPLTVRAGISYAPIPKLLIAFDEEKPRDGDFRLHVGGEWKATTVFTLRAGFQQLPNLGSNAGYTMGLGYATVLGTPGGWAGEETPWWEKKMEEGDKPARAEGTYVLFFDYAFVSYGDFSDTHRFTLGVKF